MNSWLKFQFLTFNLYVHEIISKIGLLLWWSLLFKFTSSHKFISCFDFLFSIRLLLEENDEENTLHSCYSNDTCTYMRSWRNVRFLLKSNLHKITLRLMFDKNGMYNIISVLYDMFNIDVWNWTNQHKRYLQRKIIIYRKLQRLKCLNNT